MQQSITSEKNITLNEVKSHFDQWRATRQKRGRIPDSLWYEVGLLVGRYSLSEITQALSINTNQISQGLTFSQKNNIAFVEAQLTQEISPIHETTPNVSHEKQTCSIEICRSTGVTLRIAEFPLVSLPNLMNQFME